MSPKLVMDGFTRAMIWDLGRAECLRHLIRDRLCCTSIVMFLVSLAVPGGMVLFAYLEYWCESGIVQREIDGAMRTSYVREMCPVHGTLSLLFDMTQ